MSNHHSHLTARPLFALLTALAFCCPTLTRAEEARSSEVDRTWRDWLRNESWRNLLTGLNISGGYTTNYRPNGEDGGYYRVNYDGQLLTPSKTQLGDWAVDTQGVTPLGWVDTGDVPAQIVRAEDGTQYRDGMLLSVEVLSHLKATGHRGASAGMKRTLRLTRDEARERLGLALGIESETFRLPGREGEQTPNWLTLGLKFERAEYSEGMGEDASSGLVTYRAHWDSALQHTKAPAAYRREWAARIREASQAYQAASGQTFRDLANAPSPYTVFAEMARLEGNGVGDSDASLLTEASDNMANTRGTFPSLRLQLTAEGSYAFMGGGDTNRFANLFTATLTYQLPCGCTSSYLQAKYELGNDPASPTERKNLLALSYNMEF